MENNEVTEDNKKKKSKRPYVVAIVLALALVVTITATSYAYFTAEINKSAINNTIVTTGSMEIEFNDGPVVTLENAIPGQYVEKTFSVKNVGSLDTSYDIYMSDLINSFADESDLVYTLTSDDGGQNVAETQVPSTTSKIVSNKSIAQGAIHNYTLRIEFKETNDIQDDNKGKEFSTVIRINESQDYEYTASALTYQSEYTDKTNVQDALDELKELLD